MSHPHLQSPLTAGKKGKARGPGQALRRGDACLMCRAKKLVLRASTVKLQKMLGAGIDPGDHLNNFFAFQQQQPSPASPFSILPIQEWPLALHTSAVPGLLTNPAAIHPGRMPGSPLSESVDVSMWDTAKVDQAHPGSSTNSSVGAGAGSEFDANVFTLGVDPPLPDPFAHIARAAALDEKSISQSAQNYLFTRHDHTIETISAAWLLPIVSSVVAAASGGVVSTALAPFDPALARSTVIVSYVVWGTSVPLAMFIITLWIYRSALSGTPTSGAFCSVFLL
ncbi:transporter [Saitozyma podzolica]|uniref:Transporter n=1 Tax=Saitozyma podzolica TaxID=1890683 RepID=A0A427XMV8_9TREE|nr:transporter [Saitozyma podzolica]